MTWWQIFLCWTGGVFLFCVVLAIAVFLITGAVAWLDARLSNPRRYVNRRGGRS